MNMFSLIFLLVIGAAFALSVVMIVTEARKRKQIASYGKRDARAHRADLARRNLRKLVEEAVESSRRNPAECLIRTNEFFDAARLWCAEISEFERQLKYPLRSELDQSLIERSELVVRLVAALDAAKRRVGGGRGVAGVVGDDARGPARGKRHAGAARDAAR